MIYLLFLNKFFVILSVACGCRYAKLPDWSVPTVILFVQWRYLLARGSVFLAGGGDVSGWRGCCSKLSCVIAGWRGRCDFCMRFYFVVNPSVRGALWPVENCRWSLRH